MDQDHNTGKGIDVCFSISANTNFRGDFRLYNIEWCLLSHHIHLGYVSKIFFFVIFVVIDLGERIKFEMLQLDVIHGQGYSLF